MANIHDHKLRDDDNYFLIDPTTRIISSAASSKTVLMQHDHNSERFTFEINRMVEGHDMSIFKEDDKGGSSVLIHYINTSDDRKQAKPGIYPVQKEDMTIVKGDKDDGSEDKLVFTWLISDQATVYSGILSFAIRFECKDENKVSLYRWNTAIHNAVVVNPSMNNSEVVISEYSDLLQDWWRKLFTAADGNLDQNGNPIKFYVLTKNEYDQLAADGELESDAIYALTDADYASVVVDNIVNGNQVVKKAECDSDGNPINETYLKSADAEDTYYKKTDTVNKAAKDANGKVIDTTYLKSADAESTYYKKTDSVKNYDETEGNIKDKFNEVDEKLNNVYTAKNYDTTDGTIKDKFNEIDGKFAEAESTYYKKTDTVEKAAKDANGKQIDMTYLKSAVAETTYAKNYGMLFTTQKTYDGATSLLKLETLHSYELTVDITKDGGHNFVSFGVLYFGGIYDVNSPICLGSDGKLYRLVIKGNSNADLWKTVKLYSSDGTIISSWSEIAVGSFTIHYRKIG